MRLFFFIKTKEKKLRIICFLFIASFLLLLNNIYDNKTYFIEGKFDSYDVAFNKAKELILLSKILYSLFWWNLS